ncbi:MAG: hypothetical protein ABIJ86_10670 [Spirochaetota bacterium]
MKPLLKPWIKHRDSLWSSLSTAGWLKVLVISILLSFPGAMVFGQYVVASVELPTTPTPGQVFFIRVLMNGAEALRVEAVEPLYEGPVQYIGADIRPFPQSEGPAASVDYHFRALEEGSLVIGSLSVLYDGSSIRLGSWHIAVGVAVGVAASDAAGGSNSNANSGTQTSRGGRIASWIVPEAVRVYEPFLARAVLSDGGPVIIHSMAVPGAISRPSSDGPGWTVIGTREGELNLPALDIDTPDGRVRVSAQRVMVQALPRAAAGTRAVGTWSVSLMVDVAGGEAHPGDSASWEAIAHGDGSAGFAEPPKVRVFGPDGLPVALMTEPFRFGQALPGEASYTGHAGAIGTFLMEYPGEYRVELEPYPWFDPASSELRYAVASPVTILVIEPKALVWVPTAELKIQAVASIRRLADSNGGLWSQALVAAKLDDVDGISLAYDQLSESRLASAGRRLPWRWSGPGGIDEGMAALSFIGDDPVMAFHEAARLERWSVMPGKARAYADAAAMALGIQERPRTVFPPPLVLGAAAVLLALLASILILGFFRHVSLLRLAGFMMVGLAVVFSVALILSIVERAEVYFVSLGGSALAVPSVAASVSFKARPGSVGKVLRRIPSWVFVEFSDGRNAWIVESEICLF